MFFGWERGTFISAAEKMFEGCLQRFATNWVKLKSFRKNLATWTTTISSLPITLRACLPVLGSGKWRVDSSKLPKVFSKTLELYSVRMQTFANILRTIFGMQKWKFFFLQPKKISILGFSTCFYEVCFILFQQSHQYPLRCSLSSSHFLGRLGPVLSRRQTGVGRPARRWSKLDDCFRVQQETLSECLLFIFFVSWPVDVAVDLCFLFKVTAGKQARLEYVFLVRRTMTSRLSSFDEWASSWRYDTFARTRHKGHHTDKQTDFGLLLIRLASRAEHASQSARRGG